MLGLSSHLRYFMCCSFIDMRNSFDGLAGIVRNHLKKDPISGDVFIFLNKTRTHIKLLYWNDDGFAMFYKRLERGRYSLTVHNEPSKQIKREELMMLLEGLSYNKMSKKNAMDLVDFIEINILKTPINTKVLSIFVHDTTARKRAIFNTIP